MVFAWYGGAVPWGPMQVVTAWRPGLGRPGLDRHPPRLPASAKPTEMAADERTATTLRPDIRHYHMYTTLVHEPWQAKNMHWLSGKMTNVTP